MEIITDPRNPKGSIQDDIGLSGKIGQWFTPWVLLDDDGRIIVCGDIFECVSAKIRIEADIAKGKL